LIKISWFAATRLVMRFLSKTKISDMISLQFLIMVVIGILKNKHGI